MYQNQNLNLILTLALEIRYKTRIINIFKNALLSRLLTGIGGGSGKEIGGTGGGKYPIGHSKKGGCTGEAAVIKKISEYKKSGR